MLFHFWLNVRVFFYFFFLLLLFFIYIIGSSGVNANSGASRMTSSNSLNQQQSNNSTRQQSNNNPGSNAPLNDATQPNNGAIVPARQILLTDMPVEIFEWIFQYTGYKEVSNMRLVRGKKTRFSHFVFFSLFISTISDSVKILFIPFWNEAKYSQHTLKPIFNFSHVYCISKVSTQMNQICKTILNSTFTKLQTQLMKRFQNIKKIMPRRWVSNFQIKLANVFWMTWHKIV